jgi:N-acetylglucosamine malate deacetylase 1
MASTIFVSIAIYMKLDILAFAAHPDDVELTCGGIILKHIAQGKKIGIVDLTRGEMGTRGSGEIRLKEAEEAAKFLGISARENLLMDDCFFENDRENRLKVAEMIRKYQPEIILCNAVADRHPDHGRAGKLVSDAAFIAGLIKVETTHDGKSQQPWKTKAVYHYIQDRYIKPDIVIDITEVMEKKMKVISSFSSQFYKPGSKEPDTSISSKEFQDFLYARSMEMGRQIGAKYAEGLTVERYPGVKSLFDLI